MPHERQRVDRWLWHARVVRTRTAAANLAAQGHVRINGARIDAASRAVKAGDVVTVALDRAVRVMKVVGFAERRGSAVEAAPLFEDLTPPAVRQAGASPVKQRDPGSGRPTKSERRAQNRFEHGEDD